MTSSYLKCFTLARSTQSKDRQDYLLSCDRAQALALLALYLDSKHIMRTYKQPISFGIPNTIFHVCRLSAKDIASYLLRGDYLYLSSNPIMRYLEQWIFRYQLVRPLRQKEMTIGEIVIEIFYSEAGYLQLGIVPPEQKSSLILARLHFWEHAPGKTYLRIFIGWDETVPLEILQQMYLLLHGYSHLVEQATQIDQSVPKASRNGQTGAPPVPEVMTNANSNKEVSADWLREQQSEKVSKQDEPNEELYKMLEPPRIYGKSLIKICLMVGERQQQIDLNGRIPDIETVRRRRGPSRNTLLKVPELVTNWDDVSYRWNVVTWLQVYSGHTDTEISERMSRLQANLMPKVWAAVTQNGNDDLPMDALRHSAHNGS